MQKSQKSILFDTNVLIYWANYNSNYHDETKHFIELCLEHKFEIYALTSSLTDTYYALHTQYFTEEIARGAILSIAKTFDLIDLTGLFVFEAIDSSEPDFEDGIIRVAAEALQVDAIITYDKKAFKDSFIPKMTAEEALKAFF